jgi:AcrR family transcriptional regulator
MAVLGTRDRLLAGALEVFARKGYEDARVEDICQEAGAARATFYRHFTGKDELFLALLHQLTAELDAMAADVGPVTPDDAGYAALRVFVAQTLAISERWTPIIEVLNVPRQLPPEARDAAQAAAASVSHTVGRALVAGLPDRVDPDLAALAVNALVDGVGHQIRTWDLPLDRDELVDQLTFLALRMLHPTLAA